LIKTKINNSINDGQSYQKNFSEIGISVDTTISELRDIMFNLKPKIIEEIGLFHAVQVLSATISKAKKIAGKVDCIGEVSKFDFDTEVYIFRIIQEALNNIMKHSEATEFSISFIYSDANLIVLISDNGHGFKTDKVNHSQKNGLMNMSERVKALDGVMSINSSEDGTILTIKVPYLISEISAPVMDQQNVVINFDV
jgi:signal transduction histidine kinase